MLCSICRLASAGFSLTQQPRPYLRPSDWWLSCCLKRFTRQLAAEALWVSTHAPEERGRGGGGAAPVTQGGGGLLWWEEGHAPPLAGGASGGGREGEVGGGGGGGGLAPVTQGGVGLFLGSVIPRGPSGHMVRKLVDSTNVCLKRQGRTPCWVSHRILYKPGGLFWEQERGERVQHIWARLWCQSRHVILKAYVHRPTSTVPVLLTHS